MCGSGIAMVPDSFLCLTVCMSISEKTGGKDRADPRRRWRTSRAMTEPIFGKDGVHPGRGCFASPSGFSDIGNTETYLPMP